MEMEELEELFEEWEGSIGGMELNSRLWEMGLWIREKNFDREGNDGVENGGGGKREKISSLFFKRG
jgi:hypothetical protein